MSTLGNVNAQDAGYISEAQFSGSFEKERISASAPPIADGVAQVANVAVLTEPATAALSRLIIQDDEMAKIDQRLRSQKVFSQSEIDEMYHFLFEGANFIRFIGLYGTDEDPKNMQFELFLKILDPDRVNLLHEDRREKLYTIAFSNARFNWIQLREGEMDDQLLRKLLTFENGYRQITIIEDVSRFKTSEKAQAWMFQRMGGSSTIALPTSKQGLARQNWLAAEDKIVQRAGQKGRVSFGMVQIVHKILTRGEEGVSSPGELRSGIVRSSKAVEIYPPPASLDERTESYARWLDSEVKQCEAGQKSAILTASQAYQRLVSIHPFENGNGRISRFMMDYVLYRTGLPPAILGKEVLDAVFVLNPKSLNGNEQFVRKIFTGVIGSYGHIYPNRPVFE